MTDNEKTWRKLSDIVAQIAATQAEIRAAGGEVVADESDQDAGEILERIERRLRGEMLSPDPVVAPSAWDHPDWKAAARESLEESIAKLPPPIVGARNFAQACRMVDARNARAQRLPQKQPVPWPQSTIDATLWLRKFHPQRLDAWYASHPKGLHENGLHADELETDN